MSNFNIGETGVHKALMFCIFLLSSQSFAVQDTITVTAEALKVDTPANETPKAVSVVSEEELSTHRPDKIDEALRYSAGVTAQPYGADNDTDWFKVRGFDASIYLDGNRLYRDGYYTWLLEPYGLEQIEVVKGPSAILFGESGPGGVVNAVQKKADAESDNEVLLEAGNNNHYSAGFDLANDLNDGGSVRYRLVGLAKTSDGELNDTEAQRLYLAPSLAIDLTDRTELMLSATFLRDDGVPTNPFFPAAGTLIDADNGDIDPSTNLGEPDYDTYQRTQISAGYQLAHELNDIWTLNQKLNYGYNDLTLRSVYAVFNDDPTATSLIRGIVYREGDNQSATFDNNAVGTWGSDVIEHIAMVGFDVQYHKTEGVEQDAYFSSINPWNPEYGNYTELDSANDVDRKTTKSQASLYGQYQLQLQQQWIALAGARYDWVRTENISEAASQDLSNDDSELSLNAGLMYQALNGLSPYLSYSQSFEASASIDAVTGESYKPFRGEQFEVGVKYAPGFMDGYINVAWFDITEKNALVTDPDTFLATQAGEATATGVELEVKNQLTDSLLMTASYTYTKAETDLVIGQDAQQTALIPEHGASVWIDLDASGFGFNGVNVSTGVRYVGETKDNPNSSDRTVPSVTLWDAAISYDITPQWQAALNVNNLLDETYIAGCDWWCYFGESRSVKASTRFRW